jgi:ACT domain-containing protein
MGETFSSRLPPLRYKVAGYTFNGSFQGDGSVLSGFRGEIIVYKRGGSMNAIITVVGTDKVGIIAKVSAFLAERGINIADINQTVLSGNFVMMMMVAIEENDNLSFIKQELSALGEALGVSINLMHEKVFSAMHRI